MNNLLKHAQRIPVPAASPTVAISPVILNVAERPVPLQLRITLPWTKSPSSPYPIVLLSHGHGPSKYIPSHETYQPLAGFYAAHGLAVIQPCHLNSRLAGGPADHPDAPMFWRSRATDMSTILDRLDEIESHLPAGCKLDRKKIAAVGHSFGGQTVAQLLGATVTVSGDASAQKVNQFDSRITAGVLLAAPGRKEHVKEEVLSRYPFLGLNFSEMGTKALVCCGAADDTYMTDHGPEWHADPYHLSPGSKALFTVVDGGHGLGGVASWDAKETDDEDPDRLASVQRMTWAFLDTELNGSSAWKDAKDGLTSLQMLGNIEEK